MIGSNMNYDYEIERLYHPENFEPISDCRSAEVLNPDSEGHGKCASCKENCTSISEEK